jgi:recombination protein RecR
MSLKVPSIDRLAQELSKLPGIGLKTAQRLALSIIKKNEHEVESLRAALQDVKDKIRECDECFCYTENEAICDFCTDPERENSSILCVVKSPTDIAKIESSGAFKGRYHVLHGCIAPLDGVGPEDLTLNELVKKVSKESGANLSEVVVALDADMEGDTTSLYIKEILAEYDVQVTRLAHGVPMGSYIDFVDQRTLGRALENRVKL